MPAPPLRPVVSMSKNTTPARTSRRARPRADRTARAARRRRARSARSRLRPCDRSCVPDAIDRRRTQPGSSSSERAAEHPATRSLGVASAVGVGDVRQLADVRWRRRRARATPAFLPDDLAQPRGEISHGVRPPLAPPISALQQPRARRPSRAVRSRPRDRRTTGSPTRTDSRRSARACARPARRASTNSGSLKPMPPG